MKRYSWVIPFLIVILLGIGINFYQKGFSQTPIVSPKVNTENDYLKYLELLNTVYNILMEYYVSASNLVTSNMMYGAIKGMVESLGDPYTVFLTPKESEEIRTLETGQFGGLGIYITKPKDDYVVIISPIEDTPAYKMGLRSGDKILEIDGQSTKNMTLEEAVSKMRGTPGTTVKLKIQRKGMENPFEINITRAIIKIPTVKSTWINQDKGIAYVKIIDFRGTTYSDLLKTLENFSKKNLKGLILDLRNNPGGLLESSVNIADLFLTNGIIVYTKGRAINPPQYFYASEKALLPKTPIVVLVNGSSASASEILTGALKDNNRAIVVGTKTFGKASVQSIRELSDGSMLKYTIAYYYTPSGKLINGKGIEPDVEIKDYLDDEEIYKEIANISTDEYRKFLQSHNIHQPSQITEELLKEFKETKNLKKTPLVVIKRFLLSELYWDEFITPPIVDLETDIQLKKAVEVLESKL